MSEENHPNINAAGLVVDVLKAIRARLRGQAAAYPTAAMEVVSELVANFSVEVSTKLDERFGVPDQRHESN